MIKTVRGVNSYGALVPKSLSVFQTIEIHINRGTLLRKKTKTKTKRTNGCKYNDLERKEKLETTINTQFLAL